MNPKILLIYTEATITKMMFLMGSHQTRDFKLAFQNSIRGELSKKLKDFCFQK